MFSSQDVQHHLECGLFRFEYQLPLERFNWLSYGQLLQVLLSCGSPANHLDTSKNMATFNRDSFQE